MNRRTIVGTVAMVALVAAGWGLYALGERQGTRTAAPFSSSVVAANDAAPGPAPGPGDGKKILYYHDPMVPGTKFDKPGKSPFMDMQLVPVYDEGGAGGNDKDAGGITINPRVQQNLGIRTAKVVTGTLAPGIEAVGSVAWNERDIAVVAARANGYVEKLYARAVLDPVVKGQALAALYVPDWVAAQEEFLAVQRIAASEGGQSNMASLVDGARQRMRLVGMTDAQIARVGAVGRVEPRITLVAPISGVIGELGVREGATVTSGMSLVRINGLSSVWIYAELPEALAARLGSGSRVEARAPDGTVLTGKVGALLPEVNAQTRTLKVRIEIDNTAHRLLPGMFATLRFKPPAQDDMLLVPTEAIIATGTRTIVMLAQDQGRFAPTEVQTGVEANGQTEIKKGLKAGQRVVLSGQFLLDSEASLQGLETRQAPDASVPEKPLAPRSSSEPAYDGTGKVTAVSASEITLAHEPIAGLKWPAMTMGFRPPASGTPKGLAVGEQVDFQIRPTSAGAYQLVKIVPRDASRRENRP